MRHNVFRYLLAVILIGIGVLLILDNVGVATFEARSYWINLYPLLFIVYGLKTIIDRIRYRGGSWIFGSFLFIFGTLLMLDRFGVFTFAFKDIFKLWPLLIIYLGFTFIRPNRVYHHTTTESKGKNGRYYGPYDYTKHYDQDYYKRYAKDQAKKHVKDQVNYYTEQHKYNSDVVYDATDENKADSMEGNDKGESTEERFHDEKAKGTNDTTTDQDDWHSKDKTNYSSKRKGKSYSKGSFFSIGDIEYSQDNWKVEPMRLSNLAGDFYLDFTKAFIPEKEIPISISALAGDVRILMPENIEFRVAADVKAGDIKVLGEVVDGINRSLYYETDHYHEATRKLDLTLKLKAGSIRIDHV